MSFSFDVSCVILGYIKEFIGTKVNFPVCSLPLRLPSRTRSKKRIQRTTIRIDSKRSANMAGRLLSIIARVVLQDVLRFAIIKKNHRYDAVIGRDSLWATAIFC